MSIQPLEGPLGPTLSPFTGFAGGGTFSASGAQGNASGDAISRVIPPWLSGTLSNPAQTAMFGPLPGLLQQLIQMLQSLMGGSCAPYGQGQCGNQQFFENANGASEGDPHLSFNGSKWNSMVSHPNLLDSNSIPGGFRISTQVTSPNERGVTRNQSATISLDNGQTKISMNNDGQASIQENGRNVSISAGQTVRLGNGATVTENQNGSLSVDASNGYGGRIETTLTAQGRGVNVDVTAHDVDLGGALVRGPQQWAQPDPNQSGPIPVDPQPGPIPVDPWPLPNPGPIPSPYSGSFDSQQSANPFDLLGV
jgi:hypothetical protein